MGLLTLLNRVYKVGDIVISRYGDTSGNFSTGLFLVIYNEKDDCNTHGSLNLVGLKITSQYQSKYGYYVDLSAGTGNLNNDSRVCCSKPYVIHIDNIGGYIGSLSRTDMVRVFKTYNSFQYSVVNQFYNVL